MDVKLHEKIKLLRERQHLTREQFIERLPKVIDKKEAFSLNTLMNIENGSIFKLYNLHKIACVLNITLQELIEGTEYEQISLSKKNNRFSFFHLNKNIDCDVLSSPADTYLQTHLKMKPKSKTIEEQSPNDENTPYRKTVTTLFGIITCVIDGKEHTIKYLESLSFNSKIPHYLENKTSGSSKAMIILNPKHS